MFGWLKKRFGSVTIDGRKLGYSALVEADAADLRDLGLAAVKSGDDTACLWVSEAMVERGELDVPAATELLNTARAHLSPYVTAEMGTTLAAGLIPTEAGEMRARLLTALAALARHACEQRCPTAARRLLEQAMPALVNLPVVPATAAAPLVDAARFAREQHWPSAVLGLLDRKIDFGDERLAHDAALLVAAALGGTDRAIEHLQRTVAGSPDDLECHYLLGQAHATRAKRARSQGEFDQERSTALTHLDRARQLASGVDRGGAPFSGVLLGAGSAVALLALMAPVYDEIMYLDGPLKGAAAGPAGGAPAE